MSADDVFGTRQRPENKNRAGDKAGAAINNGQLPDEAEKKCLLRPAA